MSFVERPYLQHKQDVTVRCDVEDFETGLFLYSTFIYVDKYDYVWFCQHPQPRMRVSIEDVNRSLSLVSDDKIYPAASSHITLLHEEDYDNAFIKRPKFSHLDAPQEDLKVLPLILYQEVEILEVLRQHPHVNLVRYFGSVVKRGRIIGIALERHNIILINHFKRDVTHTFNPITCIEGIRAGIKHLHSLGFAHNDLHPGNIALNDYDEPVIFDFGSCKRFGEELLSSGTPGWAEEYFTSEAQHDIDAIEKISIWLEEQSRSSKPECRANAYNS